MSVNTLTHLTCALWIPNISRQVGCSVNDTVVALLEGDTLAVLEVGASWADTIRVKLLAAVILLRHLLARHLAQAVIAPDKRRIASALRFVAEGFINKVDIRAVSAQHCSLPTNQTCTTGPGTWRPYGPWRDITCTVAWYVVEARLFFG